MGQLFSSAGGLIWVAYAMPGPFVLHFQALGFGDFGSPDVYIFH